MFYRHLKSFVRICGFIKILVVNDVANCDRLRDSLRHEEHIYMQFPNILLYW